MDTYLEIDKYETFKACPICGSGIANRPESGTHAFTIVYVCGTEIDYPIGQDGALYGKTCDGRIKRFDLKAFLEGSIR